MNEEEQKSKSFEEALNEAKGKYQDNMSSGYMQQSWIYPFGGCPYCQPRCPCCGRPLGGWGYGPQIYCSTTGTTGCSCKNQ